MKTISSRQNAWFKRVRAALVEHRGEIVIEGPKAVDDAIARGWTPVALVVESGHPVRSFSRTPLAFEPPLFAEVSDTRTSQGVIALFERPRATLEEIVRRRDTIAVALDGIQDPGNVGTIVRLAAAFGASGLITLPGCADPYSPKAIRASAGAILEVPVAAATAGDLVASRLPIFVADGSGKRHDVPSAGAILVLGSEGAGASKAIRARATAVAIATTGHVESLNVAAAAAILLSRSFDARRR